MSGIQLFADWATSTLLNDITASATSMSLVSGGGALFPSIESGSGNWFIGVLTTSGTATSANSEVVQVTATSTDTFTIVRNQGGTNQSFDAGATFAILNDADTFANFVQPAQLQAQAGNYAIDTGTANTYVVSLTPAPSAYTTGVPIRVLIGHSNSGNSTLNVNALGAQSILLANGDQLAANTLLAGAIVELFWNGSNFVLGSAAWATETYADTEASAAQSAAQAFATAAIAAAITGSGGTNGEFTVAATGAPNGSYIVKWGFWSPGQAFAGIALTTITFPSAFPHTCYFACAFTNRTSASSEGIGAVPQASLSTTGFQAIVDQDSTGHLSCLWLAIGD